MSEDRETNHTMTDRDIALLLADAADEVEIGIAPYQAVIRGGRRRRARRWALATAAALVITGTSGTLALAGLRDGNGVEVTPAVTQKPTRPSTPEERHVYEPQRTALAMGTYRDKPWRAAIEVWGAPRDKAEADKQLAAMTELGLEPPDGHTAAALIGKTSFFVTRAYGDARPQQVMFNSVTKLEPLVSTDMEAAATRLGTGAETSDRLVVGEIAKTAQHVTCHWKDGTSTVAGKINANYDIYTEAPVIRSVAGYPGANWFVCVAPAGTSYESAEVTAAD
ncbi:hypothetical protein [Streptomyces sp. cg40]|uniref:hypothetical protein n=1 Tax=Streptomyces sp. cg40 TaxID=3419764 RepID=UPI003CFFA9F9